MEQIRINPYYINLFWAVIGLLLGLIPLIKGMKIGKAKLGALALICTAFGGAILGLFLIVPVLAIFMWLILKKDASATESCRSSERSSEADIDKGP